METHCDVLVIGGGGAGLAAAIAARERGATVVLVEQNPEAGGTPAATPVAPVPEAAAATVDVRSRDGSRGRERESR